MHALSLEFLGHYLMFLVDRRATHLRSSLENLPAQHSMHVKDSRQVRAGFTSHSSRYGRQTIVHWRPSGQNTVRGSKKLSNMTPDNARGDRLPMRRCKPPNSRAWPACGSVEVLPWSVPVSYVAYEFASHVPYQVDSRTPLTNTYSNPRMPWSCDKCNS